MIGNHVEERIVVTYIRVISQIFQLGLRHSRHGTGSIPNRRASARHCVQPSDTVAFSRVHQWCVIPIQL